MRLILNKKGQVTIFIIIAVMVVILGIMLYLFWPEAKVTTLGFDENPKSYIQNCMRDTLETNAALIANQGGTLYPENYGYLFYKSNEDDIPDYVIYLCYTNEYYKLCVNQQPLLHEHIEKELTDSLIEMVNFCFDSLRTDFEADGYEVEIEQKPFKVDLLPNRIIGLSDTKMTIKKDSQLEYTGFEISIDNNLYELVNLASDIVALESDLGGADTTAFLMYYSPEYDFEEILRSDGSKIYIITETVSNNKFQFAVRNAQRPLGIIIPETEEEQ